MKTLYFANGNLIEDDSIDTIDDYVCAYKFKNGKVLVIEYDPVPQNPREDCDNAGKMVCWHNRYTLGDEQPKESPSEYLYGLLLKYDEEKASIWWNEYSEKCTMTEEYFMETVMEELSKYIVILPLYLYDHSGITISTSSFNDMWDSGQVGYIYIDRKTIEEEWGKDKPDSEVEEYLRGEVKLYDCYLRGEVYGFRCFTSGEEEESCWGFYGDDYIEDIMDQAGLLNEYRNKEYEEIK